MKATKLITNSQELENPVLCPWYGDKYVIKGEVTEEYKDGFILRHVHYFCHECGYPFTVTEKYKHVERQVEWDA